MRFGALAPPQETDPQIRVNQLRLVAEGRDDELFLAALLRFLQTGRRDELLQAMLLYEIAHDSDPVHPV